MLGVLLLVFIGRYFYELANEFDKDHKWLYPIIGIAAYYAGIFFFGLLLAIIIEFISPNFLNDSNELFFGFMVAPFGVLCTYIIYRLFKKNWQENTPKTTNIDDIGKS